MTSVKCMWVNPRPVLTIERGAGVNLGNCYYGSSYTLTTLHPLSLEDIDNIRKAGLIGYGQTFYTRGQLIGEKLVPVPATLDWKSTRDVTPSGMDSVEAKIYDDATGVHIPGVATNQYTKEPLKPMDMPYYVYVTEDRVDSSD